MIPDSLFSPSQSPCFALIKVLVSPSSKSRFRSLSESRFPPTSKSSPSSSVLFVLFLPLKVLSHPPIPLPSYPIRPLSSSQSPLPSSSSSPLLLQAKKTAERHEAVPPFAWFVPKWNISGYEELPNNPLNNVEYSYHSKR